MRILHDLAVPGQRAAALMIMLPGALQDSEEFRRTGFVGILRHRYPDIDVALVDPSLQFIGDALDETTVKALHEAVVLPAREHYRSIWMMGISLGGFLALSHAVCYPDRLDGLCLLSPYPGTRMNVEDADSDGKLPHFSTDEAMPDMERRIWHWLRHRDRRASALWLGYGAQDRFADGLRRMQQWMPQECVEVIEGRHDWNTWHRLWSSFVHNDFLHGIGRERNT